MRLQAAVAVARGVGIAQSDADIPPAYFDAIALFPDEAEELDFKSNAARDLARAKARRASRG